jgi:hypothetical protein
MSLHVNPHFEGGAGIIRYSIFATNAPVQVDTLTWIITAIPPNGIEKASSSTPVICYSNKNIRCGNLHDNFTGAALYDLNGKLLSEKYVVSGEVVFDVHDYGAQMLILRLFGKQHLIKKIFNY